MYTSMHPLQIGQPSRAGQHHPSSTTQSSQGCATTISSAELDCSRNSSLYLKTPNSDVLPRSGTEVVLFSAQTNKLSYWRVGSKMASKGLIRSELKSS